jgi:hypothetical protein
LIYNDIYQFNDGDSGGMPAAARITVTPTAIQTHILGAIALFLLREP